MPRRTIVFATTITISAIIWLSANADQPVGVSNPTPDPKRFAREINAFKQWDRKNAWPADAVLFAGSSSIRMWPTRESFSDLPVINRGFGGAQIPDMLHFYDNVIKPYAPRVIVFYCGDNDIADGRSPKQVVDDFSEFTRRVHATFPRTRVIYLPIKPSISRWKLWPTMNEANELVRKLTEDDERLIYIDTATCLLGADGKPRKDLLQDDGLHLNDAGYRGWTGIVSRVIHRTLTASMRDSRN